MSFFPPQVKTVVKSTATEGWMQIKSNVFFIQTITASLSALDVWSLPSLTLLKYIKSKATYLLFFWRHWLNMTLTIYNLTPLTFSKNSKCIEAIGKLIGASKLGGNREYDLHPCGNCLTPDWKCGLWWVTGGSEGAGRLFCWYTVTEAPVEEKDGEDDEAVAAFTTPFVMISLILLTAPGKRRRETVSRITSYTKTNVYDWLKFKRILTVNKLSCLSLDV